MNSHAWSFLTIEGPRQYGGNVGYLDDPAKVYRYDSDVSNHLQVRKDDVIILRSKATVLGIAKISEIVAGEADKERLRCPTCQATNIKERVAKEPRWKCKNGHVFAEPTRETVHVRTFEAHYADTFRLAPPSLSTAVLQNAVIRPSDQMSIKEIDLAKIEDTLVEDPSCRILVVGYAASLTEIMPNDSTPVIELQNSIIEARRRVIREINLRRGGVRFRNRLIRHYGCACQISRCAFPALVEAAHILPYASTGDNSVMNGLLLRGDLHTIFDLALLGVQPESMKITLHPALFKAGYEVFNGVPLFVNGRHGPDPRALAERWELFQLRLKRGD